MTSDSELDRVYNELLQRIERIGIALHGKWHKPIQITDHYDISKTSTPSIGEAEDAFMNWNCGILTAFRCSDMLSKEENFNRNIKRNNELKSKLIENEILFRSVNGCYREANWEVPNVEICFFVTNTDQNRSTSISADNTQKLFNKLYRLAEYYEQDCFLCTFPGMNRVAFLVATNDDGRKRFRGDIKFAGPLFTHVADVGDWTDCSDGRISFRLKGMILKGGMGNKKIMIGEGNIFDIESYNPDCIIVIHEQSMDDMMDMCKTYKGKAKLIERYFIKENPSKEDLELKIFDAFRVAKKCKCKQIGFHSSVALSSSYVDGASVAENCVKSWASKNDKKFSWIVIVDTYGNHLKGHVSNK